MYSRPAIDELISHGVGCAGYGFQVETVFALSTAGMAIVEVPIVFRDRVWLFEDACRDSRGSGVWVLLLAIHSRR